MEALPIGGLGGAGRDGREMLHERCMNGKDKSQGHNSPALPRRIISRPFRPELARRSPVSLHDHGMDTPEKEKAAQSAAADFFTTTVRAVRVANVRERRTILISGRRSASPSEVHQSTMA